MISYWLRGIVGKGSHNLSVQKIAVLPSTECLPICPPVSRTVAFLSQAAIQHIGHPCRLNEEKSIKKLGKLMEAMGATRGRMEGPPIGPIREALRLRSFSHRPVTDSRPTVNVIYREWYS